MPLLAAHRCQICGDVLFHDDFFSDPSQHFCMSVNGPAMTEAHIDQSSIDKHDANTSQKSLDTTTPNPKKPLREVPRRADSEYLSGCESDASCAAA